MSVALFSTVLAGLDRPLSVLISPSVVFGFEINCPVTGGPATANVIGGKGPYTYEWTTGNASIIIDAPNAQSTTFTKAGGAGAITGTVRCTVTDDNLISKFDEIQVSLECGT